ncbi:MAG: hypothetical protein Q8Q36_00315 [bacterium]|nr:hypothetical protein [bacterium]
MGNIFFRSGSYAWWQFGLFKLSLLSFGIAIGAYWQEVFLPYVAWFVVAGAVFGLYVAYVWIKQ